MDLVIHYTDYKEYKLQLIRNYSFYKFAFIEAVNYELLKSI